MDRRLPPPSSTTTSKTCQFTNGKRPCRFKAMSDGSYCGHHNGNNDVKEDRVQCPYEVSVWIRRERYYRHLRTCPARPIAVEEEPEWLCKDVNLNERKQYDTIDDDDDAEEKHLNIQNEISGKQRLSSLSSDTINALCEKITNAASIIQIEEDAMIDGRVILNEIPMYSLSDMPAECQANIEWSKERTVVDKSEGDSEYRKKRHILRHAVTSTKQMRQINAIMGHLSACGLLEPDLLTVEMGAGNGLLSYYMCIGQRMRSHHLLIDRSKKGDRKDGGLPSVAPMYRRLYCDVKYFDLKTFLSIDCGKKELASLKGCVAVAKHMCGGGTDVAIRAMLNASLKSTLQTWGIGIALCCHHCCDWETYCNRNFINGLGFSKSEFVSMTQIASWAVCTSATEQAAGGDADVAERRKAKRAAKSKSSKIDLDSFADDVTETVPRISNSKLFSPVQQTRYGRLAKYLINIGRVRALREAGWNAQLIEYAALATTLENVMLLAKKK